MINATEPASFDLCNFSNTKIENGDGTSAKISRSYLYKTVFKGGKYYNLELNGSYCREACFLDAECNNMKFENSDLTLADFTRAYNINIHEIAKAKYLAGAKFSKAFLDKLQADYPNLLKRINEKPKELISESEILYVDKNFHWKPTPRFPFDDRVYNDTR